MPLRIPFLLIVLFFCSLSGYAQSNYLISGRVIDAGSKEPLPFVNIVIMGTNLGTTTDIDGKFSLASPAPVKAIHLSYVGYEPYRHDLTNKTRDLLIKLSHKEIDLQEVEILPGINPAHRIIRNALGNRDKNDPEKLKAFSYTAYDKTIFTLDSDTTIDLDFNALVDTSGFGSGSFGVSLTVEPDTAGAGSSARDSANRMIEKLISEQYLFLMENVTKRKFMAPDRSVNKVIATKVSGFKDPIFIMIATQMQSFSFYKPFISILMNNYVNPIGAGALAKYFFKIEDTAYTGKDTSFIISFRPKKGTNFDGLKGIISINSFGWAIQNVTAQPNESNGGMSIRIHQMYELIDSSQWFPVQLNTDIAFNSLQVGKYKGVGRGRSYIRDIMINPEFVRREFNHADVEVDKDATLRNEEFWNSYRIDSLSKKDRQTYHVIDSLGKADNFDRIARNMQTLMTGRIPWGLFDIDINRFVNYNTYEGLILGAGVHTNDRLSEWFRAGGYFQWAFAVRKPKFGADVSFLVNRKNEMSLAISAFQDLTESGGVRFPSVTTSVLNSDFRQLMIKKLDQTQSANVRFTVRTRKYLLLNIGFNSEYKESTTNDLAIHTGNTVILQDHFRFTQLEAGFKWAYGEKFIQTTRSKISMGTRYPIVWFQYTLGLDNFLGGEYHYNRFDLQISKTFNIKYLGKSTIQLNSGYIDQPIPACNLYYAPSGFREFTLFSKITFGTMRSNEFLSNRYISLFFYHDFKYLLFKGKKWFHPEFAIAQNAGFGWLDHPEYYDQISINPRKMNLGYYESGLLVNNIINLKFYTLGLGAFYRWGPYSFDEAYDNFAAKLTMIFPF